MIFPFISILFRFRVASEHCFILLHFGIRFRFCVALKKSAFGQADWLRHDHVMKSFR